MWNTALPSTEGRQMGPTPPKRCGSLMLGLDITEVVDVVLMAHLTPITIVNTYAFRHVHTINKTKLEIKLESLH